MTMLTLDRSTLLTGSALRALGDDGVLYHPKSGLACALGQYLLSLGVSTARLAGKHSPASVALLPEEARCWLVRRSPTNHREESTVATAITEANDGPLHQIRREAKLIKLFAQQGITAQFVGRYADATRRAKRVAQNLH